MNGNRRKQNERKKNKRKYNSKYIGLHSFKGVGRLLDIYAINLKDTSLPNMDISESTIIRHKSNKIPSISINNTNYLPWEDIIESIGNELLFNLNEENEKLINQYMDQ